MSEKAKPVGGIDIQADSTVTAREDEGVVVAIRTITGDPATYMRNGGPPQPVTITVAGEYSSRFRQAEARIRNQGFKRMRAALTDEQFQANRIDLVASCVVTWEGFLSGSSPAPCTPENVRTLLKTSPWILQQLEEAQRDHASFFAPPSGT